MYESMDRLVKAVEQGQLSRREAVGRLVALAAAAFAGSGAVAQTDAPVAAVPTFQSVGLNHIALRVTDLERSRDFYGRHLGLKPLQESPYNCFMAAGGNNFVAMFRSGRPGMDHYCYTIEGYRAGEVVKTLEGAGLEPERHGNRVYFDDPDGIQVQLADQWGDYPGERPKT